jgi:hypothetical protein
MIDQLIPDLSSSDVDQIIENYWEIKKLYSEVMIDIVVNQDKPEYLTKEEEDEEPETILNKFKRDIKRRKL